MAENWAEIAERERKIKEVRQASYNRTSDPSLDEKRREALAELQAEKEAREALNRGLRNVPPVPTDKVGILDKPADPPMLPTMWTSKNATNPFKIIKGGIAGRQTSSDTPRGVTISEETGLLVDGTANLLSLDEDWQWVVERGLRVSEAYSRASWIVSKGRLALVETRLANLKGGRNIVMTDFRGYIVPMFARPGLRSTEKGTITWLVGYDDGTTMNLITDDHYHAIISDDPDKMAEEKEKEEQSKLNIAKRILLEGAYRGSKAHAEKTPKVAILGKQVYRRDDVIKRLPAPVADSYKRKVGPAMKRTAVDPHWRMHAKQDRAYFSKG